MKSNANEESNLLDKQCIIALFLFRTLKCNNSVKRFVFTSELPCVDSFHFRWKRHGRLGRRDPCARSI